MINFGSPAEHAFGPAVDAPVRRAGRVAVWHLRNRLGRYDARPRTPLRY